jgi:proteasome lid subunit RPN8/RPN11
MTDFYNFAKQQYLNNKQTTAMDISRDQEQLSNIVIEDSEEYSDSLADQVQVSGKDEHSGIYDDPADHVDQDLVKILSNDTSSEVPALNYQEGDQKVTEKLDKGDEIGSFSQIPSAFNKPFTKIDLTLFIREEIIEIAKKHAQEGIPYETGGALLGTVLMRDSSLLVVNTGLIKGKYMRQQEASLEFTPETWSYFWRSIDSDVSYKDDSIWKMVGWYHTHPSFGIFLSGMDRFIHNNFFAQPYHIALVLDPVKDTFGFFTWEGENGQVIEKPHHDITIYGESQIRELLSAESYEMPPVQIPVSSGLPE